jgi:hypothetical protein
VVDHFATTFCPNHPYSGTIHAGQEPVMSLWGSTRAKVRAERVADSKVLRLVRQFLESGVLRSDRRAYTMQRRNDPRDLRGKLNVSSSSRGSPRHR